MKLFEYLLHWRFPKVVPMGAIVIRTRYDEGTESAEVATSGCKLYLGHILTYFVSRWKFTFIYFWIMQGRMVNQQPFSHDFVSLNKIIIYDLLRHKEVLNCYINFCFDRYEFKQNGNFGNWCYFSRWNFRKWIKIRNSFYGTLKIWYKVTQYVLFNIFLVITVAKPILSARYGILQWSRDSQVSSFINIYKKLKYVHLYAKLTHVCIDNIGLELWREVIARQLMNYTLRHRYI